jgi:hypothetical protein
VTAFQRLGAANCSSGSEILRIVPLTDRSIAGLRALGGIFPERGLNFAALAVFLVAINLARVCEEPASNAAAVAVAALLLSGVALGCGYPAHER